MRAVSSAQKRMCFATRPANRARGGSALILVLIVIAMLSLGAYTFTEVMNTEYRAVAAAGQQRSVLTWAESGVEYVAAQLTADAGGWEIDLYDNPNLFHVPLMEGGGFTVVAPAIDENSGVPMRMGVMDESARINLNVIAGLDPDTGMARNLLMGLPGMTEVIADSILDWIDADSTEREYGVELEGNSLVPPRNGPLESLEELLLIEGVIPPLLYGEDANRNGLLDPHENDGDQSLPSDNADDVLNLGWIEFLTLTSKESTLQRNADYYNEPKLNVNEAVLTDLYDQMETRIGSTEAQFVTAYRLKGPYDPNAPSGGNGGAGTSGGSSQSGGSGSSGGGGSGGGVGSTGSSGQSGSSSSGSSTSGSSSNSAGSGSGTGSSASESTGTTNSNSGGLSAKPNSSSSSTGASTTGNSTTDTALLNMASSMASAIGGGSGAVTRGGMDVSSGGSKTIVSIYELIGSQVMATIDGQEVLLDSPWKSDPGSLQQSLHELLDTLTTTSEAEITGRININEARREVLLGIPDMPDGLADVIISSRAQRTSGSSAANGRFSTAGWLLIEGLVDIETMRLLDGSVTARGDVFRVQVLGHGDQAGPMARVEAVIDGTQAVPRILFQRNLSDLGPGYRKDQIPAFSDTADSGNPTTTQNNR